MNKFIYQAFFIGFSIFFTPIQLHAQELASYELAFRPDINGARGTPSNDILGASLLFRYRLDRDWLLGFGLGAANYDFERPYETLNLTSIEEIDSTAGSTLVSAWIERRYDEKNSDSYWYWAAGLRFNSVDVDNLTGTTHPTQAFDLRTDVDTALVISVTAGRRHNLRDHWALGYGARLEQRRGDWILTDSVSGQSTTVIDSYVVKGLYLDVNYRF